MLVFCHPERSEGSARFFTTSVYRQACLRMTVVLTACFFLSAADSNSPFVPGEKITYGIQKLGVRVGTATLEFKGKANLNDIPVLQIIFTSQAPKFLDEENIYLDEKTFCPLRVKRNLNIFGKKEQISEDYDVQKGSVKITKMAGGKTSTQTLEKPERMDNIYGFLYRYRQRGRFQIGEKLTLNLPTRDAVIILKKKMNLKANGEVHDSFFMQSDPKQYFIWFDNSPQHIPLRIDGALGMGKTSMVMEKYETTP